MRLFSRIRNRWHPGLFFYYHQPWVRRRYISDKRIIIIGGCERSGSTLLRAALDCHPQISAGPESWVFIYKLNLALLSEEYNVPCEVLRDLKGSSTCLSEFIDLFSDLVVARDNKLIWCEKSPNNIARLPYIWEHFPNAKVIHIIRDGRDVTCSLRDHPKHRRVGNQYVKTNITHPVQSCIDKWQMAVLAGRKHCGDARYMEVRYEDLVRNYAAITKKICLHCGVEWNNEILKRVNIQTRKDFQEIVNPEVRQPIYSSKIGRWQTDLSADEQRLVDVRAGDLLQELGYQK